LPIKLITVYFASKKIMEALIIEPTLNTPKVILDQEKNIFEFSGKSFPQNVQKFYHPILEWFEEYSKNPNSKTDFVIKFDFHSSATCKAIFQVLKILSKVIQNGNELTVYWHYEKMDEDSKTEAEYFAKKLNIPFKFISY